MALSGIVRILYRNSPEISGDFGPPLFSRGLAAEGPRNLEGPVFARGPEFGQYLRYFDARLRRGRRDRGAGTADGIILQGIFGNSERLGSQAESRARIPKNMEGDGASAAPEGWGRIYATQLRLSAGK